MPRVRQGVDVVRPLLGPQPPPAQEEEEGPRGRRVVGGGAVVVDDPAPERQHEPPVAVHGRRAVERKLVRRSERHGLPRGVRGGRASERRGRVPLSAVREARPGDETALRAALAAGAGVASETVPVERPREAGPEDRHRGGRAADAVAVAVPRRGRRDRQRRRRVEVRALRRDQPRRVSGGRPLHRDRGRGRGGVVRLQRRARFERGGWSAQVLAQRVRALLRAQEVVDDIE
mmetsp:Transcript_14792/g.62413  ORF Transcript_14792/g.62413 Transcript_14792/m.62413 type:complete len:232 (+) Transcript_14792:1340-2035(+)